MNLYVSDRSEMSTTSFLRSKSLACLALITAGLFAGCHKGSSATSSSGLQQGTLSLLPGQGTNGTLNFLVEDNGGGRRTKLKLLSARWGRLADIRDVNGVVRHRDFVVGEQVVEGNEYIVEVNPVSEKTTITIRSAFSTNQDSEYVQRLRALESTLTQLDDKSLEASELPPYPLVPRNAALVLQFDDLIDPNTLSLDSVRIQVGYPPATPFNARIVPDENHGDLADFDGQPGLEFYSTRVIVDSTVSAIEAASTNPPLPVNALGYPASITQGQPNVALRIPTLANPDEGQLIVLRNPSGRSLSAGDSGSIDVNSPTVDVVRALRSGGSVTLDVSNGFLNDTNAPSILGVQAATATNVAPGPTPSTFVCDLSFAVSTCANRLVAGDVLQQGAVFAEVICPPFQSCAADLPVTGDVNGPLVPLVFFRIISTEEGGPQTLEAGPVSVSMRYTNNVPAGKVPCFVRFSQITLPPDRNVAPTTSITVRFTEPIDPATMKPFDSMMLMRRNPDTSGTPTAYDFVVGAVTASPDLREFTFQGALPLTHDPVSPINATTGQTAIGEEPYWLNLIGGLSGPTDLPGNQMAVALPPVRFTMDATASKVDTAGFALRFSSLDEISGVGGDATTGGVGKRELRGQLLIDPTRQVLRSRPVTHYQAAADRTQPVPSVMLPFGPGVQTPLSRLGSKMQTLWRYCDVGFGLLDEANHNVDVEGLSWSPVSGAVIADTFTRFEMGLSHCLRLPDESVDPASLLLKYIQSGLGGTYAQNLLDPVKDPQKKVYPVTGGPTGYSISQADLYQGPTGTKFVPFPMNRNVARALYTYYTWRDTSLLTLGAPPPSPGAELEIVQTVSGITPVVLGQPYPANQVPTIGLPLLMEYRCYPDDEALGLNAFDISVATATSSRPNFRAFSTGGVNTQNQIIRKDPDLQPTATGGFNPGSTPTPGAITQGTDNSFYIGNLDLVTRISRVHSIWFDATTGTVQYSAPVIEPRDTEQPTGTQVVLAYRGATQLTNTTLLTDSAGIDMYGNKIGTAGTNPIFLNGDNTWKTTLTSLNGARFFQVRITFVSNPETNLSPEISAIGFTYRK